MFSQYGAFRNVLIPAKAGCCPRENVEIVRSLTDGAASRPRSRPRSSCSRSRRSLMSARRLSACIPRSDSRSTPLGFGPPCRWPLPFPWWWNMPMSVGLLGREGSGLRRLALGRGRRGGGRRCRGRGGRDGGAAQLEAPVGALREEVGEAEETERRDPDQEGVVLPPRQVRVARPGDVDRLEDEPDGGHDVDGGAGAPAEDERAAHVPPPALDAQIERGDDRRE